jgi:hypothetical protein
MRVPSFSSVGVPVIALLCIAIAAPALAQGRGRGRGTDAKPPSAAVVQVELGARDRDLITAYYAKHKSGLPPGLAKREDLPPGLERQLRRNGTLPPGLRKKITPFPLALERQLLPLPPGYRRGVIDTHVIVYSPDTFLITDVLLHIVR